MHRTRPLALVALSLLTGCWFAEPCPTEGELDIHVTDAEGNEVCPDAVVVVDPEGTELTPECDCGTCYVDTLVEGDHEVTVTVGEAELTETAELLVFERCITPRDTVEIVVP